MKLFLINAEVNIKGDRERERESTTHFVLIKTEQPAKNVSNGIINLSYVLKARKKRIKLTSTDF